MMEPSHHEIYPSAPLEFVACEVRFPLSPSLAEDAVLPRLHRSFYDWLPLVEPGVETTLIMAPGAAQPPIMTKNLRFIARNRRLGVLVSPTLLSIETTAYSRYEDFRTSISRAFGAIEDANVDIAGLTRIGLRYIDEVRVPDVADDIQRWTEFIDQRLSSPVTMSLESRRPSVLHGTLQFELGEGQRVVMRYGAMRGESVSNAPLRRREHDPSGQFFLIDIDSFWMPHDDALPEFSVEAALTVCDRLHRPVWELFEAAVTERLRNDVLRRAQRDD
jgi:uncharacterized protein (TIGR04255 family)